MADGIAITAGSGTTVATDDAGAAGHVQIIKLAISADGQATAIPADATNGLDVDVTRLPALAAGTNNIGDVDALIADGADVALGATTAAEATGDGPVTGLLKRLRTLLAGGLPASLVNSFLPVHLGGAAIVWDELNDAVTKYPVSGYVTVPAAGGPPHFTALEVKRATFSIAASQTNASIVALVASRKLRVLSYVVRCGATATTFVFRTGTSADISHLMPNGANGGEIGPNNEHGWWETASGAALTASTGAGSTTTGLVTYVEVP